MPTGLPVGTRFQNFNRLPCKVVLSPEIPEGTAAGRDVVHILCNMKLGDGRQRVAAAAREKPDEAMAGEASILVPPAELVMFEYADRAVPDDGASVRNDVSASLAAVFGPTSRMRSCGPTSSTDTLAPRASADTSSATTTSTGNGTSAPRSYIRSMMVGFVHQVRLGQRVADTLPVASRKVLAMPP